MIQQTEITNMDALVESMRGLSIVDGGYDGPDGIHLELSDGRLLIVTGIFVVGLCRVSKAEVH